MSTEATSKRETAGDELRSQNHLQKIVMAIASLVTVAFFVALAMAK